MANTQNGRADWVGQTPNFVKIPSPTGDLTYANHHVIATDVYDNSPFLKALALAKLRTIKGGNQALESEH